MMRTLWDKVLITYGFSPLSTLHYKPSITHTPALSIMTERKILCATCEQTASKDYITHERSQVFVYLYRFIYSADY
jgi:hypothetical protein